MSRSCSVEQKKPDAGEEPAKLTEPNPIEVMQPKP
jgi:hypothetical protein